MQERVQMGTEQSQTLHFRQQLSSGRGGGGEVRGVLKAKWRSGEVG